VCLLDNGTTNLTMTVVTDYCWYNLTSQANGTEVYRWVWANDTAGNMNRTGDLNVTVNLTSDLTPPIISISTPANITYTTSTIQLNVSANEPINTWWYQLNTNGTNETFTPNSTIYTTLEGLNNITVWANDTTGNEGSSTRYFTIDTTAPGIAITSPLNQSYSAWGVNLNVTTSEPAACLYNLNGGSNTTLNNDSVTNWFTVINTGSDGLFHLYAYCNDTLGNMGMNDTIWFTTSITEFTCNSCSDCTDYLINGTLSSGDTLRLTANIINYAGLDDGSHLNETCISFGGMDGVTFDCDGYIISGDGDSWGYGIWLNNSGGGSNNNTVMDCTTISYFHSGLYSLSSDNSTFTNITASNNEWGIRLYGAPLGESVGNAISNTDASNNQEDGIYLYYADSNIFINITANTNTNSMYIHNSSNNTITSINSSHNQNGIHLYGNPRYNAVNDSRIENSSGYGIYLEQYPALDYPRYNTFYNNYLNNSVNMFSNHDDNENYFNTTLNCAGDSNIIGESCIGGNYWTDPDGSNFSDTCTDSDSDGICDSNYTAAANNTDYLPLTSVSPAISGVANGTVTFQYAYILWETDKASTSVVYYSTNQSDLSSSVVNSSLDTSHNVTVTGLTGSTVYYYNVSSCDSAGNCNTSGTYNFTTSPCVESWSCGEWSECSGSIQTRTCVDANNCGTIVNRPDEAQECDDGGSTGGVIIPPETNPYESHSWGIITPGNVTVVKINKVELGVREILISVNNSANSVYIRITKYNKKPADITHNLTGRVYQYMELYTRNLDDSLENATIRFSVNRSWINENGISDDGVALNRYENRWERLVTRKISEGAGTLVYEAETPGFSYFAVTGENATEGEPEYCGNGACEPGEDAVSCPQDCSPEQPGQVCSPGSRRCSGNVLEQCSSGGTGWETMETCSHGCSPGGCLAEQFYFYSGDYVLIGMALALSASGAVLLIFMFRRKRRHSIKAYCLKCRKKVGMKNASVYKMSNGKDAMKGVCPRCGNGVYSFGIKKGAKESSTKAEESEKEAYCLKCRKKVMMKDGKIVTMKNGRKAWKGTCTECGSRVFRMGAVSKQTDTGNKKAVEGYCLSCKKDVMLKDYDTFVMRNGKKASRGKCPDCRKTVISFD
ncbi:MAG: PGF-pre-PGF domain-containing protein, partial [Candidatus Aenigmarchaeota archaeon]|nr:PGF-pre-PGF domain-containing protein [Candidatus Aenigmarchaeota archaeon]